MYNASSAFHMAVANGSPQMALLIFSDAVFCNRDINVSVGIEFNDYFNVEEDLSIGQALSNEISFNLFNEEGLLNNYAFGDFLATIGAQISTETVTAQGTVQASSTAHTYVAYSSSPYLKRDGTAVSSQPDAPVVSILIYDGTVYCRLSNGTVKAYTDSNGNAKTVTVNSFMLAQMNKWAGEGIFYNKNNRLLKIWHGTTLVTYEFVPLGYFTAERPNVPAVNEIHFTCNDFMMKFDRDMPSDAALGIASTDYPLTFKGLLAKMATAVGVSFDQSSMTVNSNAKISARVPECNGANMREVVQWIAEAGAAVARFNRDGVLVLDWIRTNTGQSYDETGYKEFNPYWYHTKTVNRLYNRSSAGEYDKNYGSGSEAYLIQDNPFLKGVT